MEAYFYSVYTFLHNGRKQGIEGIPCISLIECFYYIEIFDIPYDRDFFILVIREIDNLVIPYLLESKKK